ncbi:MAG: glycosyltransferase, partial [Nitriliruptoraceae bacterium]
MDHQPLLSVVVPVYDVEAYLPACLDSILSQDVDALEVLVIDDGSPDASGELAEAYAARDGRVRVIHQDNAGLGATRNRGAALVSGRYLAFVDSDDVVPPGAYRALLAAIEASGSDLATGDVRRLTSVGLKRSPTFSPIYRPARTATHVSRDRALLQDRIAPNKLFRRDFWQRHGLAFGEGVLYEDITPVLSAHLLARQVDVLDRPVYHWRIRQGADRSITQRRLDPRALADRIAGVDGFRRLLASRASAGDAAAASLARDYDRLILVDDLRLFADQLDRADDHQVAEFLDRAGALLDTIDPAIVAALPARERLRWHLVASGDAERLVAEARSRRIDPHRPARRHRGALHLDPPVDPPRRRALPLATGPGGWPAAVTRLGDDELDLRTGVNGFAVRDGRLVIDGWAAIAHHVIATPRDRRLSVWLERDGGSGGASGGGRADEVERIELE